MHNCYTNHNFITVNDHQRSRSTCNAFDLTIKSDINLAPPLNKLIKIIFSYQMYVGPIYRMINVQLLNFQKMSLKDKSFCSAVNLNEWFKWKPKCGAITPVRNCYDMAHEFCYQFKPRLFSS